MFEIRSILPIFASLFWPLEETVAGKQIKMRGKTCELKTFLKT